MGEKGSAPQPPIFEDEEGTWWGTLPIQWLVTPATSLPSEAADPYSTIKLLCPISRLEASFHLHSIAIYTQKSHFKHFCLCLYWVVLLYQGEFNSLFCTILCTQDNYSLMDQALMLDHRCFARRIRRNKWTPLTTFETMIGRTMQAS